MSVIDVLLTDNNVENKKMAISSLIKDYNIPLSHNYLQNAFSNIACQLKHILYYCVYPIKNFTRDKKYVYSVCQFVLQESLENYKDIFIALMHGFNDNFTVKLIQTMIRVDVGETSQFVLGYSGCGTPSDYASCPYCKLLSYNEFSTLGLRISINHEFFIDSFKMKKENGLV
jgi:hypothetical protein